MEVLDRAVGDGGEHPSSQTPQASLSILHMCLPPGFPPFPPTRRVFLAASGVSVGSEGKPAHITLPLSSLLAVCHCKISCAATYSPTWAFCVHPCPSLQFFSTALLGIFCIFDTAVGEGETSKGNSEIKRAVSEPYCPQTTAEDRDVECPLGGFGPF